MSKLEPVKVLNRILNRLCQIDRFGYFSLPVTEAEAPGYYSVIDRPMCFSMMREKIDARQYRTWGDFLSDFNLMLRNALYFNDKKSIVYRTALLLNKEGNERLKEVDIEARQAIYLQHPGGPAAAAEEEAREFESRQMPVPMNPFLMIPPEMPKSIQSPFDLDDETEEGPVSDDAYSSFSETESEGEMRGQGCPSVMKMQTTLNDAIEEEVKFTPWHQPLPRDDNQTTTIGFHWTEEKARIEWRCKWLQLRMKELESYAEHYASQTCEEEDEGTVLYGGQRDMLPDRSRPVFHGCEQQGATEKLEVSGEDSCEEDCYAGRAYLSLGIMVEEATKLTALLTSRQRISQSRMFSAVRTTKKSSAPRKKPTSSTEILEPKRSRRDFEHALHHSDSFGTSISVEKPTKLNITVPSIVEITLEKSEKWEKAKRMLKQSLEQDPDATMPQEVMQALQLSADEGSSEEDITDEVYLTKHQQMELAERERHLFVLGGLDPKRRKLPEKRTMRSSSTSLLQGNKPAAKRGRGRSRGVGRPVGRPPAHHRSHNDLLHAVHADHQWITSLPLSHPLSSWPASNSSLLSFPSYTTCPTIPVPHPSTHDVTAHVPTTTSAI